MIFLKNGYKQISSNHTNNRADPPDQVAKDWFYDRYQMQEVLANRWQLAFWIQLILSLLLVFFLIILLPLKSWEPIVIERDTQTGEVWVRSTQESLPKLSSEIESDLVNYVVGRETYSTIDHDERYQQIQFSSTPRIFKAYKEADNVNNPNGLSKSLGEVGLRKVVVEDIIFLDGSNVKQKGGSVKPPSIAKVDFTTVDTIGEMTFKKYWVATMTWEYLGTPNRKEAAWINWNGFTVSSYRVDQRNV